MEVERLASRDGDDVKRMDFFCVAPALLGRARRLPPAAAGTTPMMPTILQ